MSVYTDLSDFLHAHRSHGDPTWWTNPLTPSGYLVRVTCPCGVVFERWVLPQDAEEDLLLSCLRGALN